MFHTLLKSQRESPLGNLVELGTYQAKSAVIIGSFVRPGERFVAVDLFGREDLLDSSTSGLMNRNENRQQYKNLNRQQFESNYLALHDGSAQVHEGLSTDILDLVEPSSARFVHVDAGHMYDQVRQDVINAQTILRPGGIVAFDDYRTEHTPGVSAAVWQAVISDGLVPVAITPQKMYAIHAGDDPEPYRDALKAFVESDRSKWWMQEQYVLGRPLLRIKHIPATPPAPPAPPTVATAATTSARAKAKEGRSTEEPDRTKPADRPTAQPLPRRVVQIIARDIAPPALTRWVRGRRAARIQQAWPSPRRVSAS